MVSPKILFVLTSFGHIDSINRPTGWYLPELAHPWDYLSSRAEIVVASPKGGAAPLDPESVESWGDDEISRNFLNNHQDVWENTIPIHEFLNNVTDFAAIFYVGGHAPMFDLPSNKDSIQLIEEFYAAGKVVSAVCHGPAVFTNAYNGARPLIQGKRITGVSNEEEASFNTTNAMPFLLEDAMKQRFALYSKAEEIHAYNVEVDGNLITGQNPASATGVAEAIARALGI